MAGQRMIEKKTNSSEETKEFGSSLAKQLTPGSVVGLVGPLGSGKTVFVQGICSGLGVQRAVTSPSFVIINEYPGRLKESPIWVYHFDLYRLENVEEFIKLGYEEYFYGKGITLIEWAEKVKAFLPEKRWEVHLEILSENERQIRAEDF
ncbi:MAG: tRNA (adenosine(37)-N6)-threonylcarbamoyltransferase complex ATPase subunit type 1 TsaE [candidate division Zixibacteria bacterium]|nr:tRNA (adenosine(37)-N6)-threonylcarbamoyltransferase complex ATPase subunit type 1 TsaE [candidate division Zixibacteria bacterium]